VRYFRYFWNEDFNGRGTSTHFYAVNENSREVERQVEIYADATVLAYDQGHVHDDDGMLADQLWDFDDSLADEIDEATFREAERLRPTNR